MKEESSFQTMVKVILPRCKHCNKILLFGQKDFCNIECEVNHNEGGAVR